MDYLIHLLILIGIYGILGLSLNLVVGYTGLLSVTHAAFYGLGAYATGILLTTTGMNFFLSLLVGALVTAAASFLIGAVLSKFAGDYFALVPSAASKTLYEASGGNLYNVQYSLEDESKFIAEELTRRGYKRVALVSYQNAFSKTHVDSFRAHFKGDIVYHVAIGADTGDISTEVAKIKASRPDVIYSPDISFFFAGGVAKLRQFGVVAPVFSTYVAELPVVRTLVPDVFYYFPKDIAEGEGAVFGLSEQAAEILSSAVDECKADTICVQSSLSKSGLFDENGVAKREMILKQVKNGQPVAVN